MVLFIVFLFVVVNCSTTQVFLKQGGYIGKHQGRHVRFLGIPYAEMGPRFEPPIPFSSNPPSSYLLRNATEWKAACPDFANKNGTSGITKYLMEPRAPQSEDCLNANIFVPDTRRKQREELLPVLVFIYGGAFHSGSSSSLIYDPGDFIDKSSSDKSFICVSFDYRLGPLGYLISESTEGGGVNGNYGLLDQITALNWVFDNIIEFGGDSKRISVMGQSAGAISASWIYKLEHNVLKFPVYSYIVMSGVGSMWAERGVGGDFEIKQYQAILNETRCENLECLKKVRLRKLQRACRRLGLEYTWGPSIDNFLITDKFHSLPPSKSKAKLLITGVRDEGTLFIPSKYKKLIDEFFNQDRVEHILSYYGLRLNLETVNAILTDGIFICPLYKFYSENRSSASIYLFNRPMAVAGLAAALAIGKDFGVFHGSDILMLFGNQKELAIFYPDIIRNLRKGIVSFISNGTIPDNWQLPLFPGEHQCETLWNITEPLIPKNYKSKLSL